MRLFDRFGFSLALLTSTLITATASAQDKPPPVKNDPAARALYDKMLDAMKQAPSLSYDSAYKLTIDGKQRSDASFRVRLRKPGQARVEGYLGDKLTGLLVGDGKQYWTHWPDGRPMFSGEDPKEYEKTGKNSYMREESPADKYSIAHRANRIAAGAIMFVVQPAHFFGYLGSLHPLIDGVTAHGTETIDSEPCDVIEVSFAAGQRTHRLWLSKKDHLPRLVRETVRTAKTIVAEERWTNIKVGAKLDDELFTWTPPAGWTEWQMPNIQSGVLPTGTQAPDFEFRGADGKPLRLSDFKGKVVWLNFWRVGCPPCRVELKMLVELQRKYKDQGLVVLGYNCADDAEIANDLLKEYGITFPCVVDNSEKAMDLYLKGYQRGGAIAVPLNYLVDRDGKIVAGWYGHDEKDPRPAKALEKLGIK